MYRLGCSIHMVQMMLIRPMNIQYTIFIAHHSVSENFLLRHLSEERSSDGVNVLDTI